MQTFMEWVRATYPNYKPKDLDDMKMEWCEVAIEELSVRLTSLEHPAPPVTSAEPIEWPASPPICSCATFGGNSDDWLCPNCGGGRF